MFVTRQTLNLLPLPQLNAATFLTSNLKVNLKLLFLEKLETFF